MNRPKVISYYDNSSYGAWNAARKAETLVSIRSLILQVITAVRNYIDASKFQSLLFSKLAIKTIKVLGGIKIISLLEYILLGFPMVCL